MEVKLKYTREETQAIIIADAERLFGKAKPGFKWVANERYGGVEVELIEDDETPPPAPTPADTKKLQEEVF